VTKAVILASAAGSGIPAPLIPVLAQQGGVIAGQLVTQIQNWGAQQGGSLGEIFNQAGWSPRFANCASVAIVAPPHYHFIGNPGVIADEFNNAGVPRDCSNDTEHPGWILCGDSHPDLAQRRFPGCGWAAWKTSDYSETKKVVTAVFKNWSGGKGANPRFARLYAFVEPD
jgi:hypothetical protein